MKMKFAVIGLIFSLALIPFVSAANVCSVYFTGVGCPHCAKSDPILMEQATSSYDDFVVIEYEIYQQRENSEVLVKYNQEYETGMGIPLLIFDGSTSFLGDNPIVENINTILNSVEENDCLLLDSSVPFEEMNLNDLPGKPKIWSKGRILIKVSEGTLENDEMVLAKNLLISDNFTSDMGEQLSGETPLETTTPIDVPLSGKNIGFSYAVKIGQERLLQYNTGSGAPEKNKDFNYIYVAIPIIIGLGIGFGLPLLKRGGK